MRRQLRTAGRTAGRAWRARRPRVYVDNDLLAHNVTACWHDSRQLQEDPERLWLTAVSSSSPNSSTSGRSSSRATLPSPHRHCRSSSLVIVQMALQHSNDAHNSYEGSNQCGGPAHLQPEHASFAAACSACRMAGVMALSCGPTTRYVSCACGQKLGFGMSGSSSTPQ